MMREPTNIFMLADGSMIKSKIIVSNIKKAEKRNTRGEPIYWASKTNNITIIPNTMQIDE